MEYPTKRHIGHVCECGHRFNVPELFSGDCPKCGEGHDGVTASCPPCREEAQEAADAARAEDAYGGNQHGSSYGGRGYGR